ncbi:MAG: hypothetical protein ACREP4_05335 [Stenotrophomonas sp.]|uniref:hypothetical protein n=1 Tax=Stenotrophomonas sp. TaxID=69392 RepID=UPI003D6CB8B9
MDMGKRLISVAATAAIGVSAGCSMLSPQIPKCSDTDTLNLVREIIAESLGATGPNSIPVQTLTSVLNIELPHATSLEENIKKYSCEANLLVNNGAGNQSKLVLSYTSQLDDEDRHLVHVAGFNQFDQITLAGALAAALQAQRPQAPANVSSETDSALASANAITAETAQTSGLAEPIENTPEQVAANEAIRERFFSGNGEGGTPKFTDYPVADIYSGSTATLDTSSEEARTFRTRISDALSRNPVDFAGEYTSASWGCGTSCSYTTFVNKRTGQVIKSGLGGELGPRVRKFVPDSDLLIAEGGEVDDDYNSTGNYAFFYRLQNDEFQLITKVPVPEEIY